MSVFKPEDIHWDEPDINKPSSVTVMGYSYDTSPHVGEVPDKPGQYICAGFDGHGMPVIFLAAKGLADMIHHGKSFEDVHLPRLYKSTAVRITNAQEGPEGGDIFSLN